MILIGGGSRSGKTRFALQLARSHFAGRGLAYVATAELLDEEMRQRAQAHREERGGDFSTIEEPLHLAALIENRGKEFDVMVVDCLTLWLSNMMLSTPPHSGAALRSAARNLAAAAARSVGEIIFVTNEVGCGIVPETPLARQFRDYAGWINQDIADHATDVYWMIFGQPLKVKG